MGTILSEKRPRFLPQINDSINQFPGLAASNMRDGHRDTHRSHSSLSRYEKKKIHTASN